MIPAGLTTLAGTWGALHDTGELTYMNLVHFGMTIGIRDTRKIDAIYNLTEQDVRSGRPFHELDPSLVQAELNQQGVRHQ